MQKLRLMGLSKFWIIEFQKKNYEKYTLKLSGEKMTKDYFNSIYDKFWEKQTKVYGVTRYEKYIIHEIVKESPRKCLRLE